MTTTPTTPTDLAPVGEFAIGHAQLLEAAKRYFDAAYAPNTRRAYQSAWSRFAAWCGTVDRPAVPIDPETVALYAVWLAESQRAYSTINVAMCAIEYVHRQFAEDAAGAPRHSIRGTPAVWNVLRGIRREIGVAPSAPATPLTVDKLRAVLQHIPDTPIGRRDRAVLLLGFAGAFRRSELGALTVGDLRDEPDGYVVSLTRSKTDQEGAGRLIGIPRGTTGTCPVTAVRQWLEAHPAPTQHAPLFLRFTPAGVTTERLGDESINHIVQNWVACADLGTGYSGHSLRAGYVTSAAQAGKTLEAIMRQTGHKKAETALRYIRPAELFRDNPAAGIGL